MFKSISFLTSFALLSLQGMLFAEEEVNLPSRGSVWQPVIMIGVALMFFYFIMWRPEQKRRKTMERKRSSMKKGDQVTVMGIIGHVDSVKEKTVILRLVEGSKMEVMTAAISDILPSSSDKESSSGSCADATACSVK
ncbi:UPF0092 membrane protein [Candidatus Clavichlamydia salmonicola]|uniref:preprotein translocase subunit YajC n=1 Tax=Candidatus Clavichlamydia salmonicola TaxID=469812 RepID=UPI00189124BF|nr:preprotein translocase subunit YajC [Candidatus Clavichlamydia salmonicola]MBF5050520.1 UPF0092 membrane protein [Candidatus Clavichlamydia salmonicola]